MPHGVNRRIQESTPLPADWLSIPPTLPQVDPAGISLPDFFLGFGFRDIFSRTEAIQCYDVWEMRNGYHVTITNRLEDLPPWFRLHPTEVCDSFVYKMMPKVEKGDYPSEPVDGPNLWRLKSGDRLAWVGADRPERKSVNGVLAILDFDDCALAVGEGDRSGLEEELIGFGRLTTPDIQEDVARCQAAVKAVKELGLPRTGAPEWMLG
jgi:hypothetical protein